MQYLNNRKRQEYREKPGGFTLVELIVVMVVLGILGTMGASFISQSFKGFAESDARMEIYEEGKSALVRMEREIRNAIPNAFAANPTDLRFGLIDETAMACLAAPCTFGQYTDNNTGITNRNFINDRSLALPVNSVLSIYNLNWTEFAVDSPTRKAYAVQTVPNVTRMTLDKKIVAASPTKRFYAVGGAIRYYLDGTTLRRAFTTVAHDATVVFPAGATMARNVSGLNFKYLPSSPNNYAVVIIDFSLNRNGESLNFHKEVEVRNAP